MKTKKIHIISIKSIIGSLFFSLFGIFFILVSKAFTSGRENWIHTTGEIVALKHDEGSKSFTTLVTYHVGLEEYKDREGDVYSSTYYVHKIVEIKYNPSNHAQFTMIVDSFSFHIPFIIGGSVAIVIGAVSIGSQIFKSKNAVKMVEANNSQLNLNYMPRFLLEYVPLSAENIELYDFSQQLKDFNNFEVKDSKGNVIFYTKLVKKGFMSASTYQLIDSTTKQTTIVNIKKSSNSSKVTNGRLGIKVDNLPIDKYFETRYITYRVEKENDVTKYILLNNGLTLGTIFDRNSPVKSFEIETAKENIDDLSLFALCLSFK